MILSRFVLILLFIPLALFGKESSLTMMTSSLDLQLSKIVEKVDPEAYILLSVQEVKSTKKLPGTPFAIGDMVIKDSLGRPKLSSIDISIYTRLERLPDEVEKLIEETARSYGPIPKISVKRLPDYVSHAKKLQVTEIERVAGTDLARQFLQRHWLPVAAGLLALVLSFLLTISAVKKSGSGSLDKTVEEGVDKIASAIENGGMGAGANHKSGSEERSIKVEMDAASSDSQVNVFSELDAESLQELLMDCYWGKFDKYANYIWSQLSLHQRRELIARCEPMQDYSTYFCALDTENLKQHQTPYYLNPLGLSTYDNVQLTEAVRSNQGLSVYLPEMRLDVLGLSVVERIKLPKEGDLSMDQIRKILESLKPAETRKFAKKSKLRISTVEEEREILALEEVAPDVVTQLPSLGWLQRINEDKAAEILASFSAQELASIWIGPEEVLEQVKTWIPEKKFSLIESYSEGQTPDRESEVFASLHELVCSEMYNSDSQNTSDDREEPAA